MIDILKTIPLDIWAALIGSLFLWLIFIMFKFQDKLPRPLKKLCVYLNSFEHAKKHILAVEGFIDSPGKIKRAYVAAELKEHAGEYLSENTRNLIIEFMFMLSGRALAKIKGAK